MNLFKDLMTPPDAHLQIGALLFEGLDQIDLTGPFEVLSRLPNATIACSQRHSNPCAMCVACA